MPRSYLLSLLIKVNSRIFKYCVVQGAKNTLATKHALKNELIEEFGKLKPLSPVGIVDPDVFFLIKTFYLKK